MIEFSLISLFATGTFVARLIVGGILLVAGLAKLKMPSSRFLQAIMGYEIVPQQLARILAGSLPWVEMLIGGLLIIGFWSRAASILATVLFLSFSTAIIVSLLRGKDNDCGCFQSVTPVQMKLIYRNWILLGLLLPIYILKGGVWAIDTRNSQVMNGFQLSLELVALILLFWIVLPVILKYFFQRRINVVIGG